MEPFLNKEITGAQLPFLMKFERVEGIATMQYKLFSPHDTWLPKPPNLTIVEDGHLPLVNEIERNRFEWVIGREYMIKENPQLATASTELKERSLVMDQSVGVFDDLSDETASDMLTRFAREENGIFCLQKRMQLPPKARNKDALTRRNTADHGYIVWLQDSEEFGNWCAMDPLPIIPDDIVVEGSKQSKRQRTAAHDIDTAARNMLRAVRVALPPIHFFDWNLCDLARSIRWC